MDSKPDDYPSETADTPVAPARYEFRFGMLDLLTAVVLVGIWTFILRRIFIYGRDVMADEKTFVCALVSAGLVFVPAYVAARYDSSINSPRAWLSHLRVLFIVNIAVILAVSLRGVLTTWGPTLVHIGLLCALIMAAGAMLRHRVHEHAECVAAAEDARDSEPSKPGASGEDGNV